MQHRQSKGQEAEGRTDDDREDEEEDRIDEVWRAYQRPIGILGRMGSGARALCIPLNHERHSILR